MTGTAQGMLGVLDALDTALSMVAQVEPGQVDALVLVDGISRLMDAETRLRAAQAAWLAVADAADAVVGAVGRAASAWLVEDLHLTGAEAGRRIRLARGLAERPRLADAVARAQLTTDQATVVLHGVQGLSASDAEGVEAELINRAAGESVGDLNRAVDAVRQKVAGESADEQSACRHERRTVQIEEAAGGAGLLTGRLTSEGRETLKVAMHAAGGLPGPDDRRTVGQRQHDALQEIAAFYLAHADTAAPETGERPRVVVTLDYDQLRATVEAAAGAEDVTGVPPPAVFDSGAPVGVATVRRLACDAGILPAVLAGRSEQLDLGRASRSFSLAIRRAAKLRDGGSCARYGCRRRIVDCHHIVWWSRGGSTDLDNAVWLCAFHHWLVHEGGWRLRRIGSGRYVFTDLQGQEHGPPPDVGDPPSRTAAA